MTAFMTTESGVELHGFRAETSHDKCLALTWLSLVLAKGYTLERLDFHDDLGAGVAFLRPTSETADAPRLSAG